MKNSNQSHRRRQLYLCLSLIMGIGLIPLFTGCVVVAAGAAGAGAVAYVRGELEVNLEHDLDTVFRASQQAVAGLEFAQIDDRKSGVDALLISRTALDKRVEIKLKKISAKVTKVQIRIGLVGDQELSQTVLAKIREAL